MRGSLRVSRRDSIGDRIDPWLELKSPDKADAWALYIDALPSTWRGLNRVYNRLVSLAEAGSKDLDRPLRSLMERYREAVDSVDYNVPSFVAIVQAVEERYPTLGILDAFEQEPSRLRQGLESNSERWGIGREDQARLYPVRDRLLDDAFISGRERGQAEPLLQRLGWLWRELWGASEDSDAEACLVTLSVRGDAMNRSEPWWSGRILEDERRYNIELQSNGARPTAADIRQLWERLQLEVQALPEQLTKRSRVFGLAPLSLMALFGWKTRRTFEAGEALAERQGIFRLLGDSQTRYDSSARFERVHNRVTQGAGGNRSHHAVVVLDVRPDPDPSPVHPFRDGSGAELTTDRYVKLLGPEGYVFSTDAQVAEVLAELRELLRELKRTDDIQHIHLGLACPSAIAFLVGRHLHPWAPVSLYEFDPHATAYRYVATVG